ncbi:MAG: hypothetical protein WAT79_08905 [Saprospiraceae bacterium]
MAGKLFTDFEVSQKIRDIYLKLNCIVLEYPAFNKFPPKGKAHTLYINTFTNPNELWRWDCTLKDYVQIGGGGGGGAQVNSDWNSISGVSQILNKPTVPVITQVNGVTIPAASFSLVSGLYEATYSNVAILSTSYVSITPKNSTISIVTAAAFLPEITVSLGSVKMFCTNLPSADFDINILIIN